MQITILGNGAGGPFQGRYYTAQVLHHENQVYLIDCGEATQMQLYHHKVRYDQLKQIFISHLHGDHVFGLVGLITSFCLKRRTEALEVFAPAGIDELIRTTFRICGVRTPFELIIHEVDAQVSAKVFENHLLEVWTIPLHHRTLCAGWLFREKNWRQANIRSDKIAEYNIHYSLMPAIKAGGDLTLPDGTLVPHAELTTLPRPPVSYAFCSDTAPSDLVVECVRGVDLLYHEATFTDDHLEEAGLCFHATASQAADIARRAGVKKLLIGHFSSRYKDLEKHLQESRAIFPQTFAAEEGKRETVAGF